MTYFFIHFKINEKNYTNKKKQKKRKYRQKNQYQIKKKIYFWFLVLLFNELNCHFCACFS